MNADSSNWKIRPKMHDFQELVLQCIEQRVNPRHRSCLADEDLMGKLSKVGKMTHKAGFSLAYLRRHLLLLAVRWSARAKSDFWYAT